MLEETLGRIAEYGVIVAILVAIILYFYKREDKKDAEIEKLHNELRENEKESLTALLKLSALIDKMLETDKVKNEALLKEMAAMRTSIENKIDNLK
jgi:uncharacterized membrane protein YvbJ